MTISKGDVVVLNSGGPKMTVDDIDEGKVWCEWFVNGQPMRRAFAASSLKREDPRANMAIGRSPNRDRSREPIG